MPYPQLKEIVSPLLVLIFRKGGEDKSLTPDEAYDALADYFSLPKQERDRTRESGSDVAWENDVRWAREQIKHSGYLDLSAPRGVWKLSAKGIQRAEELLRENQFSDLVFSSIDINASHVLPDELKNPEEYEEGKKKSIFVNLYERNIKARKACIDKYGAICFVCDFDFLKNYGEIGEGFIHVHHLIELSEIGKEYKVNPIEDLRPVCPNCHAMLHMRKPAYKIEELEGIMRCVKEQTNNPKV